ncbi:MAG: MFS transporter [Kineosporiaceae bacterium]
MLAAVAFVVALGFGIVIPAISLFAEGFGVGKTAVGLAVSAFAFARFVSGPLGGRLVERFGERPVLVAGLLTVAVTSGTAGFAGTFGLFVLLRAAGGVGSAAFTVAAFSLLLRLAPEHGRARAAAVMQGGFLVGGMFGPGLGGLLTDVAAWLPFVTYGGFLLVAAVVAATGLPAPQVAAPAAADTAEAAGIGTRVAAARRLLLHPAFAVALLANLAIGWTLFGVRNSLVTLYVVDIGGTPTFAGLVLVAGAVTQAALLRWGGRLADRRGRRPAIVVGSFAAAAAVGLLAIPLVGLPGLVLATVSLAGFGGAAAFLSSAPGAVLGDLGRTGTRVAVFQMASDLGAIVGPLAAGALADLSGYPLAFGVSALVMAVVGVAALRMPETAPGLARDPAATTP